MTEENKIEQTEVAQASQAAQMLQLITAQRDEALQRHQQIVEQYQQFQQMLQGKQNELLQSSGEVNAINAMLDKLSPKIAASGVPNEPQSDAGSASVN